MNRSARHVDEHELTHAGGVVYRERAGRFEILLVRARPAPHAWVLPKGHIEPGESPGACAVREVREEAEVAAEPILELGHDRFTTSQGKTVVVRFYLMRYLGEAEGGERRAREWCLFDEARARLPFEGARALLAAAEDRLHSR